MRKLFSLIPHPRTFSSNRSRRSRKPTMKIAVEGCCHGELDAIYASLTRLQQEKAQKVDLLLIGGDFQVPPYPPTTTFLPWNPG